MRKILISMLAAIAGALTLGGVASTASAAPAGRHQSHYGNSVVLARHFEHRNFSNRHYQSRHFEHRRHFRRGPVLYFGSGNNNGCYWLKRKALNSGSRYWWHRYNECRWG
jgi:hypothetical protein